MFDFDVVTDEKTAPRRKAPPERQSSTAGAPTPRSGGTAAPAALGGPAPTDQGGKRSL